MGFITEDKATVFHCLKCNQIININADECRYCGTVLDKEKAKKQAEILQIISYAQSDSGNLKFLSFGFLAIAIPWKHFKVGDILESFPFKKLPLKSVGAILLFIPFLVMCFRWQKNYGKYDFTDSNFLEARKVKNQALLIAIAGVAAVIIIDIVITLIILRLENGSN